MNTKLLALASALTAMLTSGASAEGCNIADILFGKVRIELIRHKDYSAGVIFGDDFDSKRFSYYKIVGQIASPERDGSRAISDVSGQPCGTLQRDLKVDTEFVDCPSCSKAPVSVRRVTSSSFAVISGGAIVGTIRGALP